ncbi:MAG: SpoIID/LytB domain-containing protein [Chlamydiia bacterium]|nr:SpoIID/LytB domain-containing protein [Chlamydiia bacterium]
MKIKTLIFFLSLPFLIFSLEKETPPDLSKKPATIKVLIAEDSEGILLEVRGPYRVFNPENEKRESSGSRGKRYYCYPHSDGIKWGENFLGIHQLQIVPTSHNTTILVDGRQYRGSIEVYHLNGKLKIVNEVDVENFIKATLTETLNATYTPNVMDAIAIIARTDAYYKALMNYDAFYHVKASDVSYHGVGLTLQNLDIDQAVDKTRHLVMTYEEQPFPAAWTENSGGKTANYASIYRKNTPTPAGVEAPFAQKIREDSQWSFTINTQELAKVVKTNRVTGIDLFVDRDSGRVYATRLHDGSHQESVHFETLQQALGPDKLKSNDFSVSLKGNVALFEGHGEGTGVGLCLYSAQILSEKGQQAPQILETFFPGAKVEKMRSYPEAIVTARSASFVSPKQKQAQKKKYRLLHK